MEEKKKGKGVKVFLVIFIILFVLSAGALGYGYTKYKDLKNENTNLNTKYENVSKDLDKAKKDLEETSNEIEKAKKAEDESYGSDYAYSLKNIACEMNDNKCAKSLKVKYNGQNHNIKIEKKVKFSKWDARDEDGNDYYDYTFIYKIYEDNNLIDTIKLPGASWGGTTSNSASVDEVNFDGYVYIFNGKYLGVLYTTVKGGYSLNLYNGGKLVENIIMSQAGMSFGKNGSGLDELDKVNFDGKKLSFWALVCNKKYNKAVNIELTFDGKNVTYKSTGDTKKVEAGGAEVMMCYDNKKGTYRFTH